MSRKGLSPFARMIASAAFAHPFDDPQTESKSSWPDRFSTVQSHRPRNVGESTLTFLRVAHDAGNGVKAHGLRVDESAREFERMMHFDPRRRVDQKRERRGVRFGKAVLAEAFDMGKKSVREFAGDAPLHETLDELAFVTKELGAALPSGHVAP